MGHLDPIAYTADADYWCRPCIIEVYGSDDAEDGEGNPIGAVFSWDEWFNVGYPECETLVCGRCEDELDSAHIDGCVGFHRGDRVRSERFAGVALWFCEADGDTAIVQMVGDDRRHRVDLDSLTRLEDSQFCGGCGQIGCGHG